MMNSIRNSSILAVLMFLLILCADGCKSKKKAMEAANAEAERARLEQEANLRKQKEEELRKQEEAERARREAETKETARYAILNQYFNAITNADNVTSANNSISEVLTLFASPDTPVLIVISESDGQKDYDRPTTIKDYLNYLKDQKKNINKVSNLQFDSSGKITEVELKKN